MKCSDALCPLAHVISAQLVHEGHQGRPALRI
jgi:hypothetical protein